MSEQFKSREQDNYISLEEADREARQKLPEMTLEQFEQAQLEAEAFRMFSESGAVGNLIKFAPMEREDQAA